MIRVLFALLLLALPARGESVVAGLSADAIGITASFDGSTVLIYGAIKRDAPEPDGKLGVIVTLEGPRQKVTVRRKSREFGIWINSDKLVIDAVPSYYAVASSAPIESILPPWIDKSRRISVPLLIEAFAGPMGQTDGRPFAEALLRIREREGVFKLSEGRVRLVENTLFRADFDLPANLIEGDYTASIYLVRDGTLIDNTDAPIRVRRVGLERWLYVTSRRQPALYGVLSLALAVFAGWAAAAAFRMIRN